MSKTKSTASERPPDRQAERSPERQALAAALAAYTAAEAVLKPQRDALARIEADMYLAHRDVDAAEHALEKAARVDVKALADAYVHNDPTPTPPDLALAETTLAKAKQRIEELNTIRATLKARLVTGPYPVEAEAIKTAVRDVVVTSPEVARLAEDFQIVKRTYNNMFSTLRWLAFLGLIPDHLRESCPKKNDTYFFPPDPAWEAAIAKLASDPDAALP
jgi:hypothetical protein